MKNEISALNEAIIALEEKRARELVLVKTQLHITYESLKPINLLKSTFKEAFTSPELKSNAIYNVIGVGAGFLTKKLWGGNSNSSVRKLVDTVIQFAVARLVIKKI